MGEPSSTRRHRWRDYRTAAGRRPVEEFIDSLDERAQAAVAAAMKDVAVDGLRAARHLRGDIYEVRAHARQASFRILFAPEGAGRIFLSLEAISKKTQRTPQAAIRLAEQRLNDWRSRART